MRRTPPRGVGVRRSVVPVETLLLILVFEAVLSLFLVLDWGWGALRGAMVLALVLGLAALRYAPRRARRPGWRVPPRLLTLLVVLGVLFNLALAALALRGAVAQGSIPLDEGETSWRAARLLRDGQNPYAVGAVVDFNTYVARAPKRAELGIGAEAPDLDAALRSYDATLDPKLRTELL